MDFASSSTDGATPLFNDAEAYSLADDGAGEGVTVGTQRERVLESRLKMMTIALVAVGVLAIVGIAVGISAHSQASTTTSQVAEAEAERQRNYKSELAGMMVMNQPVCRQTYFGYVGCLDLMSTVQAYVRDLADADVTREAILDKLKQGSYNIGNALAFATTHQSHDMAALHPGLKHAVEGSDIELGMGDLIDMQKCDYVWQGVGCLRMVRVRQSPECQMTAEEYAATDAKCSAKVVPIVHIVEDVEAHTGRSRRSIDQRRIIGGVAGGVPDKRPIASLSPDERRREVNRRRGQAIYDGNGNMIDKIGGNGACHSGLGEPLLCHCNSRGCGYLDYNPSDFKQDFGKNWDHPDVRYGGDSYSFTGATM
eukprot:UC1_evm1s132